jgi:hydrogenase expression/formation protein HypD
MIERERFVDPKAVTGLVGEIRRAARGLRGRITLMEVCGTHTNAIAAAGLRRLLPDALRLISGPGCPVCVTPIRYVDRACALARRPDVVVCTFGDLLRVPSSTESLERVRAEGGSVRVVYSPRDALAVARAEPDRRVVFLGVGFETTVPTVAAALAEAEADGPENLLVLSGHKVMPPPLRALASDPSIEVDGFLCPGHVAVVTGSSAFTFLPDEFGIPAAVTGFAPTDILQGVLDLTRQRAEGRAEVSNLYTRVVTPEGNRVANRLVERCFRPDDAEWRGLGTIPGSGLALRDEFAHRDAMRIDVELPPPVEPEGCRCGEVLTGSIDPPECPLFAQSCTPATPIGACMVSAEGACAAWYRHERIVGG